jgi:hypothetical protein
MLVFRTIGWFAFVVDVAVGTTLVDHIAASFQSPPATEVCACIFSVPKMQSARNTPCNDLNFMGKNLSLVNLAQYLNQLERGIFRKLLTKKRFKKSKKYQSRFAKMPIVQKNIGHGTLVSIQRF